MDPLNLAPVVAARDFPRQAPNLYVRRDKGELWSPLPGIFTRAEDSVELRIASAQLWAPGHVLCGTAAAHVTWWPEAPVNTIQLRGDFRRAQRSWLSVSQGSIDPEWLVWVGEYKVAAPALSALQSALVLGGNAIDEALRRGITLAQLHEALEAMPKQKGKKELRRLLAESRDEPWSPLERKGHVYLRKAKISGWKTNHKVVTRRETSYIDIAFPGAKIAVEIDGFGFHSSREAFERDRRKQNLLVLDGWTVLRFTSQTIHEMPEMVLELLRRAGY